MAPKAKATTAGGVEHLRRRRQEVDDDIADLAREAKRLKAVESRAAKRKEEPFTEFQKQVAVTLYLLDGWRVGAAISYLEAIAPGHSDLVEAVETWALKLPWEVLDRMREEDLAPRATVYRKASAYLVNWRLERWTEAQNDTAGLAPPTAEVLRQHDRIAYAADAVVGGRRDASQTRNRMWASRWRRNHGVVLGTPQVVDDQSYAEKQQKVRSSTYR